MQCQRHACGSLDLPDSWNVQALLRIAINHGPQHAVHVADSGRQNVNSRGFHKLLGLGGSRQAFRQIGSLVVDFRPGSDVADFSFDKNRRIDGLQYLDGISRLATFCSKGKADKSYTIASNPALAASTAFGSEWV